MSDTEMDEYEELQEAYRTLHQQYIDMAKILALLCQREEDWSITIQADEARNADFSGDLQRSGDENTMIIEYVPPKRIFEVK